MRFNNFQSLFLLCTLVLPGCAIRGYVGPKLPDDQVATISLKAPAVSLVPLFWVFPLDMLTWLADDWYETSWNDRVTVSGQELDPAFAEDEHQTPGHAHVAVSEVEVNSFNMNTMWSWPNFPVREVRLDRFTTVVVRPGQLQVKSENILLWGRNSEQIGSASNFSTTNSAPYKDKDGKEFYGITTSYSAPFRHTQKIHECQMTFIAEAGQHYEVFIRDSLLMLRNVGNNRLEKAKCIDYEHTYEATETSTSTTYHLSK